MVNDAEAIKLSSDKKSGVRLDKSVQAISFGLRSREGYRVVKVRLRFRRFCFAECENRFSSFLVTKGLLSEINYFSFLSYFKSEAKHPLN